LTTTASIVIPTRARPRYLEVALGSIAPQAAHAGVEVLVVDDAGPAPERQAVAERFGARYVPHPRPLGLNHARNTGVAACDRELVIFIDDDVEVAPGWLDALLRAADEHADVAVFTGPVHARLEGRAPRSCGREGPPVTSLDLGSKDTDAEFAWGANMTIRRQALERIGPFDVTLQNGGDEQDWQERLRAQGGGRVLYVAAAALDHRRDGADARMRALARSAFVRGRAARRFDARRAQAPSIGPEMRTLAGCVGHVLLRRCPAGMTMVAHSTGRLTETLRERALPKRALPVTSAGAGAPADRRQPTDDFLSGESGTVGGVDGIRRRLADSLQDASAVLSGRRRKLRRAARSFPERRSVLVLGPVLPEREATAAAADHELRRSRHDVQLHHVEPAGRGKFEVLNSLYAQHAHAAPDWLLTLDDDVVLPRGFLDCFLFLAESFALDLAQPAQRLASHAAWSVTRRRARSVVRETRLVEIGPVTAFSRATLPILLPFPALRMGWGLDAHWAAVAREHQWRCGVVDGVPVRHDASPVAGTYSRAEAIAEARTFLAGRPYLPATELRRTLVTHRRW
jgi:GT2 family glycosyltransferase